MVRNLSYSQVNTYQRCPQCWAERYTGERDREAAVGNPQALYFGHTVGPALQRIAVGEEWESAYAKTYDHFNKLASEQGFGGLAVPFEHGYKLIHHYINDEGGPLTGRPEQRFELYLPDLPPIIGFMDLEATWGVGEYKTSAAKWDQQRVDSELQGTLYWLAFYMRNGRWPERLVYVVFPTTGTPESRRYCTQRTADQITDAIAQVREAYQGMLSGTYEGKCPIHKGGTKRAKPVSQMNPPVLVIDDDDILEWAT